jgi:hypothetical protein
MELQSELPARPTMEMDELRRQTQTLGWPLLLRADGKEIAIDGPEEVMVPRAGNLICVYRAGAFEVIDCKHVSIICRERAGAA